MRPFDTERFSDQLVKLPEIIFGLVIAQSLVSHREVLIDPFPGDDPWSHVVAVDRAYRYQDAWGKWTDNTTHHWVQNNGRWYLIWDWTN